MSAKHTPTIGTHLPNGARIRALVELGRAVYEDGVRVQLQEALDRRGYLVLAEHDPSDPSRLVCWYATPELECYWGRYDAEALPSFVERLRRHGLFDPKGGNDV